ncbi:MAG TPA: phosphoglycerate dehydrogenase [Candidatus Brocadiia bacterium]|nr:phosphoglycerate dehydrogenase [Candidatus Brocadiia bacterium]
MFKVLIADSLGKEGLDFLAEQPDVQTIVKPGLQADDLKAAMREADAMIIRSGVKVTAPLLADPGALRVIARAGVGVDNVDLQAATKAGVLVLNTPDANTISTAELTMAHMLALSRKLVPAAVDTAKGGWDRKTFHGVQLAGKTLGIVGFGRIGRAVAKRAIAMEMRVIVFDPFYAGQPAADTKFCASIDELIPQVDIVTVHTPLTPETTGLIGARQFAIAKRGLMVINCARGGIIDEAALAEALKSGQVAAAGIDVFTSEPPKNNPLIGLPNVVTTPHLGASTAEAQAGVALEACRAVLAYLRDGEILGPVNIAGVDLRLDAEGKRLVDLSQRMGAILARLVQGPIRRVKLTVTGQKAQAAANVCSRFMLVELLQPHLERRVNVVNVAQAALERDINVEIVQTAGPKSMGDSIEAHVSSDNEHSIAGFVGSDKLPHVQQIDGYRMDMIPEGQMVLIRNSDQPGAIGVVGAIFGNARVNIANMSISRQGPRAMMVIHTDGGVDKDLLAKLRAAEQVLWVDGVDLPPTDRANGAAH